MSLSMRVHTYMGSLDGKRKPVCIYGWSDYPDVDQSYLEIGMGEGSSSLCELWKNSILRIFSYWRIFYLLDTDSFNTSLELHVMFWQVT